MKSTKDKAKAIAICSPVEGEFKVFEWFTEVGRLISCACLVMVISFALESAKLQVQHATCASISGILLGLWSLRSGIQKLSKPESNGNMELFSNAKGHQGDLEQLWEG